MRKNLDTALALAAEGFHVFPIVPGKKAPPLIDDFPNNATRDPQQIINWWAKWPDANIGISTTRYRDGALLVIDIDDKGDKHGSEALLHLELQGYDLPATRTQTTPTGGRHLVYSVPAPLRQGADVLGRGLDVRSRGGYIVAAGSTVGTGHYASDGAPVAAAPSWLAERIGAPRARRETAAAVREAPSAEARAIHYLTHDAPIAVEGDAGDHTTYRVAATVKDFGATQAQCLALLAEHWNPRCEPPWDDDALADKVANAYKYGTEAPGAKAPESDFTIAVPAANEANNATAGPLDRLNNEFAFVIAGGGAHILWETADHKAQWKLEHLTMSAFHQKFAAKKMQFGKRTEALTNVWMEWPQRRSYDGLVFAPGKPVDSRFYNLWRGFAVEPATDAKHPAVDAFLDHARRNVCNNDAHLFRWMMGWFAHMIQRPWEKPLVALVFRGGKGVGKGALIGRISALLGNHALLTSNRRFLVGNFNGHMENLLLFTLDEAFWSGDKQAEGQIKDLITGSTHVIEHKGKESFTVDNVTRICIIGNEEWLVPATHDERRFAVFDVGDGRKQDRQFFHDMRVGMEQGGYACLLRYLLDFDLTGIDVNAAPATEGLRAQKEASLPAVQRWWLDCLANGRIMGGTFDDGWPAAAHCALVRNAFLAYASQSRWTRYAESDTALGREIGKVASVTRARGNKGADGVQHYEYRFPPLEQARAEWDVHMGHKGVWD